MPDYNVVFVNPDQLYDSPHQPPSRMASGAALNHLISSIKTDKLQYPPLVLALPGDKYQVIDGHRRIAAMKELGFLKIPVLPTQGQADNLFAAVSGNVAKMKSSEWVTVYLRGGIVPQGPLRTCITKLEETMGYDFLKRLEDKQGSPSIWNLSNRVMAYTDNEFSRESVLEWLMKVPSREVSAWISGQLSKVELKNSIKAGRSPKAGNKH